jgi:hypothetical protein
MADTLSPGMNIRYSNLEEEGGSDHEPFVEKMIPACWFFTGFHPDYHDVYDIYQRINTADMTRIANLGFRAVWKRANEF